MKSSVIAILPLAVGLTLAQNGVASPPPWGAPVTDAEALADTASKPKIESLKVPGTSIQRIRATMTIDAPIDRVRTVVFDYGHYPEFMPLYEKAGVIWTTPAGARLVHMELGGTLKMWMRVEISAPHTSASGVETYEGKLVQGSIKAFQPRWELESLGPQSTRVTVESFMDPDLPLVPSSLINSGARDGVRDAIIALKARIEGRTAAK